jgi:DNA-binding LacI/PurR family transcriptional regulator
MIIIALMDKKTPESKYEILPTQLIIRNSTKKRLLMNYKPIN